MRELDAWHSALRRDEGRDSPEKRNVFVPVDSQVGGRNPTIRLDGGGFSEYESGASNGA
jgi:hypothetical protein